MAFEKAPQSLPAAAKNIWLKVANEALAKQMNGAEEIAWSAIEAAGFVKEGHKWSISKSAEEVAQIEKGIGLFNAPMSLEKAHEKDGEWHIVMKASGRKRDASNDRMEKSALNKMVGLFTGGKVGMRESHKTTFSMAKSTSDSFLGEDGTLYADMVLDKKHPYSAFVFEKAKSGELPEQVSVFGSILKKDYVWDQEAKTMVKSIQDVNVNYLDFCPPGDAIYKDAGLVEAMVKSVSWEDPPAAPADSPEGPQGGDSMDELLKSLESTADKMEEALEKAFPIKANMLQKSGALKEEFVSKREDAVKKAFTPEQVARLEKAVERMLNACGNETLTEAPVVLEKAGDVKAETEKLVKSAVDAAKTSMTGQIEELKKSIEAAKAKGEKTEALEKANADLEGRLKALEAQPVGGRPAAVTGKGKLMAKSEEGGDELPSERILKSVVQLNDLRKSGQLGSVEERIVRTQAVPEAIKGLLQAQMASAAQG